MVYPQFLQTGAGVGDGHFVLLKDYSLMGCDILYLWWVRTDSHMKLLRSSFPLWK